MTTKTIDLDRFATKGEARAARSLVHHALRLGYAISVNDGEEWTVRRSRDRDEVLEALASTGEDTIRVSREIAGGSGAEVAVFWLIYGNDPKGEELISDYTDNRFANELYRLVYPDN